MIAAGAEVLIKCLCARFEVVPPGPVDDAVVSACLAARKTSSQTL